MNEYHQVAHILFVSNFSPKPQKIVSLSWIPTWNHDCKLEGEVVGGNISYIYLASSSYPHMFSQAGYLHGILLGEIVGELVGSRIILSK